MGTRQEAGLVLLVLLLAAPAFLDRLAGGRDLRDPPRPPGSVCGLDGQARSEFSGIRCVLLGLQIPVNRAREADFMVVPGIGPALASRIVKTRTELGAFNSLDDLERVRGIGPKRIEALRRYLTIDSPGIRAVPP